MGGLQFVYNTSLAYVAKKYAGEKLTNPNYPGDLVMFFGNIAHGSNNMTKTERQYLKKTGPTDCRMTLAFDISLNPISILHPVPLFDPRDPWWRKDPLGSWTKNIGDFVDSTFERFGVPATFEWGEMPNRTEFAAR